MKIRILFCLERIIKKLGNKLSSFKDNEKIITTIATLLSEGSLEVRDAAKKAIVCASNEMASQVRIDRLLQKALNETAYAKIKAILSKEGGDDSISSPMSSTKKGIYFRIILIQLHTSYR